MGAEAAADASSRPCHAVRLPPFQVPARAPRLRTTLPGRTRARARAPGPPPWRPCCPGRSSSPVSCNLATTPLTPDLGGWGLQAPGDEAYRSLAPARVELQARGGETVHPPRAGVHAPPGGKRGAWRVGGCRRGANLGNAGGRTLKARRDGGLALRRRRMSGRASPPSPGEGDEVSILYRAPRRTYGRVSNSFRLRLDWGLGARGRQDDE